MVDEVTWESGAQEDHVREELVVLGDGKIAAPVDSMGTTSETFWQRFCKRVFAPGKDRAELNARRLEGLNQAIEMNPDAPTNYLLRGEIYLNVGAYELAASDFRRALELASVQVGRDRWGLVAQTVQDRAQAGLAQAKKALGQRE